jgi:2-polyprenyl-3-methyl-5-hydroxy-6-metoxy-1,4-benzoquinol methylase
MSSNPEMTSSEFDDKYRGKPVWDIGRPQKAFVDRFERTPPKPPVLDIGCGSGDLTLYVAAMGCDILGVDFAPRAIEQARAKAEAAGSKAVFEVRDILSLQDLDRRFNTVLDCCFFHVLDDSSRIRYEQALQRLLEPGGTVYMLCRTGDFPMGPRAVFSADVEQTFGAGWSIVSIEPSLMELSFLPTGLPAIFTCLKRDAV